MFISWFVVIKRHKKWGIALKLADKSVKTSVNGKD